jgi:hypothetical protein
MDSEAAQIDGARLGEQVLVTPAAADCAEHIHRAAAGEKKMMTGAGESRRLRSQHATRRIAVAGFEFFKRGLQASEVGRIAGMYDIEIEGRDRCAADHRCHAADYDQLDVVPGEDLKGVFESRWAGHDATRRGYRRIPAAPAAARPG